MGAIMTRVSKNEMETYGKAGAIAEEVISSIRTVIAFGGEDKEVEKYSTEVATARKSGIYRGILTGMNKKGFCLENSVMTVMEIHSVAVYIQ